MEMENVTIKISEDGSVNWSELSAFLFEFRRLYIHSYFAYEMEDDDSNYLLTDIWEERRNRLVKPDIVRRANEVLSVERSGLVVPQVDLKIKSITKNSPFEIVACCAFSVLTIAVVFSGGEIKTDLFEVKLPPLGEGVKRIREALRSEDEFNELLHSLETLVEYQAPKVRVEEYEQRIESITKRLRAPRVED